MGYILGIVIMLFLLNLLSALSLIFIERKEPTTTWAWLLILIALPGIGFILYFGPFLAIFIYSLYKGIKNIKYITLDYIMYLAGAGLAIALSTLSGYVYFIFSSMLLTIIINVLLLEKAKNIKPIGEVVNKWKK